MKLRATRSNLNEHAARLLGVENSSENLAMLIGLCVEPILPTRGEHLSHALARRLATIDKVLGNHGVEGMLLDAHGEDVSGSCDASSVAHDIMYSNTGDAYAMTIFWHNGALYIGDWGSVIESIAR